MIRAGLAVALAVPLFLAATSPLLAWRDEIYIGAGFAGILALGLLLIQPLLIAGYLPDLTPRRSRRWHGWVGGALCAAVVLHVAGLWLTSPPDVVDALLFRSPTPFSDWGVIAMWAIFAAALLAVFRRKLGRRPTVWRACHAALALVAVFGTAAHAVLIEGTMEPFSKFALCALACAAVVKAIVDLRPFGTRNR